MVRLDAAPAGSRTALKAEAAKADIAMLETMIHDSLKEHWLNVFGVSAPHNLSRRLLIHALAYELQVRAGGGLKKAAKQMLADAVTATCPPLTQSGGASADVEGASSITSHLNDESASDNYPAAGHAPQPPIRSYPPAIILSPGTRLMREWHGVVHVVDVVEGGFMWNGKVHGSLSAIARAITGVRWNGLTFFGLRKRRHHNAPKNKQTKERPAA